jgi:hypothetical protein
MNLSHHIYTSHLSGAVQDGRCRESVHDTGRSVGYHQCSRKATVFEDVEIQGGLGPETVKMGFCKQHSLQAQQAREDARNEEANRKARAEEMYWKIRRTRESIVKEVMAIAESDRLLGVPSLPGDLGKLADDLWHLEKKRNGKG